MYEPSMLSGILPMSSLKGLFELWPFDAVLIGNSYFFVIATLILLLVLIGICLLVKYSPNLLNDLRNGTNGELPDISLKLWIALVLIFPIFFDAGPLWFVLWWFLVFWGYQNIFEKRIFYVFISFILMSGLIAHIGAGVLMYADSNVNREIFTLENGIGSSKDLLAVSDWVRNNQADAEPMNIQALSHIEKGEHAQAVILLTRSLDLKPNNSRYYNHLGVALAGLGKNTEAIKAFQNAVTLNPGNVVYHYNLSRIYQATFNFFEAERSIKKASSIDPERVRSLLDKESKSKSRKKSYATENVPLIEHLARQMKPSESLHQTADSLWNFAFGIFQRNWVLYFTIGIFIVLFLLGHIPEEKFTKRCSRCGNLYYAGATSKSGYPMCLQCLWIETKPKKQMNTLLAAKTEEIKSFRSIISASALKLELILPGMGSFYVNKTLKAVVRLMVFSASLIMIITGLSFIHPFIPIGIDFTLYARIIGVVSACILYWRAYKSPPIKYGA